MKTTFFLFLFLFLLNNSFSQSNEFAHRFDLLDLNLEARDMVLDSENGVIVVGNVEFETGFIANIDQAGNYIWSYQFSNPTNNFKLNKVLKLKDSTFVAVGSGYNSSVNRFGAMCIHFNSLGDTLWVKSIDNNSISPIHAYDVIQLQDSTILITGEIEGEASFAVNLDAWGNKIWGKSYKYDSAFSQNIFKLFSVEQQNNDDLIFCGNSGETSGENFGLVLKTDVNGSFIDSKTFSSNYGRDFADLLIIDSSYVFLNGNGVGGVLKTDFSFNILWDKVYSNLYSFQNNPNEYRKNFQLVQLYDSTMLIGSHSEYGGAIIQINLNGGILKASEIQGQSIKAVEGLDSSLFVLMNGPILGVKTLWLNHFGISKVDSLDANNLCMYGSNTNSTDVVSNHSNNLIIIENTIEVFDIETFVSFLEIDQYSGCVDHLGGITENIDSQFTVFPNPFANELTIERTKNDMEYYEILDYSGRIILKGTINGIESIIQTTNLENGYYFIKIGNSSKSILKIN